MQGSDGGDDKGAPHPIYARIHSIKLALQPAIPINVHEDDSSEEESKVRRRPSLSHEQRFASFKRTRLRVSTPLGGGAGPGKSRETWEFAGPQTESTTKPKDTQIRPDENVEQFFQRVRRQLKVTVKNGEVQFAPPEYNSPTADDYFDYCFVFRAHPLDILADDDLEGRKATDGVDSSRTSPRPRGDPGTPRSIGRQPQGGNEALDPLIDSSRNRGRRDDLIESPTLIFDTGREEKGAARETKTQRWVMKESQKSRYQALEKIKLSRDEVRHYLAQVCTYRDLETIETLEEQASAEMKGTGGSDATVVGPQPAKPRRKSTRSYFSRFSLAVHHPAQAGKEKEEIPEDDLFSTGLLAKLFPGLDQDALRRKNTQELIAAVEMAEQGTRPKAEDAKASDEVERNVTFESPLSSPDTLDLKKPSTERVLRAEQFRQISVTPESVCCGLLLDIPRKKGKTLSPPIAEILSVDESRQPAEPKSPSKTTDHGLTASPSMRGETPYGGVRTHHRMGAEDISTYHDITAAPDAYHPTAQSLKSRFVSAGASSLPPVYGLSELLRGLDSAKDDLDLSALNFSLLMREVFIGCLRKFGCDVAEELSRDREYVFCKVRLREGPARAMADHLDYNLQLDRKATSMDLFRDHPDYVPPYIPFDGNSESLTKGFASAHNRKRIWCRYDLLNRPLVFNPTRKSESQLRASGIAASELTIDDIYQDLSDMSVFRDVDRIRLLSYIVDFHFNIAFMLRDFSFEESVNRHEEKIEGGRGQPKKPRPRLLGPRYCPAILLAQFPLHKACVQAKLRDEWGQITYSYSLMQPYDEVRNYFGEEIAFYFLWTAFFTDNLKWPALLGILLTLIQYTVDPYQEFESNVVVVCTAAFALYISIWSSSFAINWSREEQFWRLRWGMDIERISRKVERHMFKFDRFIIDPLNPKKFSRYYDPIKIRFRAFVSSLLTIASISFIVVCVIGIFSMKWIIDAQKDKYPILIGQEENVISSIQGFQIMVFDFIWFRLVKWLTKLENHKYERDYRRSFVVKMFIFRFTNNMYALLYIAFAKNYMDPCLQGSSKREAKNGCLSYFRLQLIVLYIFYALFDFFEIAQPLAEYYGKVFLSNWRERHPCSTDGTTPQMENQWFLTEYDTALTIEDHMEIVMQFCSVLLFSVALPLLPLLAYLVNLLEIRVDALKLVTAYRRAFPVVAADGLAVYNELFTLMGLLALPANVALCLFFIPIARPFGLSGIEKLIIFVMAEHALIVLRVYNQLNKSSDKPETDAVRDRMLAAQHNALWGHSQIVQCDEDISWKVLSPATIDKGHARGARKRHETMMY